MVTDRETNFIYISDLLVTQSANTFNQLKYWFDKLEINYDLLHNTKDLWVVDFMPLQVEKDRFVQFNYDPDYLKPKKYQHTKTDTAKVSCKLPLESKKINITIDGGNIVKHKNKAIATDKIFRENPGFSVNESIAEIKYYLEIEDLIIIPQEPKDFVGHADGMIRFINEKTVLVNTYPKIKPYKIFAESLMSILYDAGLNCIEFPYTAWQNEKSNDATGCYINFLEIGNYIFYPTYEHENDVLARTVLEKSFYDRELINIDCRSLAKLGGVLNCATWNILV